MNNIHEFKNDVERMLDEEQRKYNEAANEKELYNTLKEEAAKKEKAAKAAMKELELARKHAEKAQASYTVDTETVNNETVYVPTEEAVYASEKETTKKSGSGIREFLAGAAVVLLLTGGYKLVKDSKIGDVKVASTSTVGMTDPIKDTPETRTTEPGEIKYDYEKNEAVLVVENEETTETETANETAAIEEETVTYEELTTENFENLVANYANKYGALYTNVSTEDITKFALIANIDILAEENPELIPEVAQDKTKEEVLNDAAKLIGASVMNNFNVWNSTHSTENFIRVSDIVYGSQKEQMLKIEEYVDRIADAANQDDADLVNEIVSEFLVDMNSGDLSKLDDGVGFVAQVDIAMISDGIARNYLNKQNFDMLQVLKSSEKYVSNIFTVYDQCAEDAKTYTR